MKKKELARCICFLVLLALVFQILTTIFIPKWYGTWQSTRIVDGFYEMPENSMDVVLLGSSQTIMGLSPMELYENYGISAYSFGTEEQPLYATYYWMKEILRYQKPKVAVLDVNELIHTSSEAAYRKAFDYMRWSPVKWEAVKEHCKTDEDLSLLSYVLPLTNYHSRWDELEESDFSYLTSDKTDPYLGFVISGGTCEIPYSGTARDPLEDADPAAPEAYAYLQKLMALCQEQDVELLLVKTPRAGWKAAKHNLVQQVALEHDLPFLDFNDLEIMEAMNFDYGRDARDGSHLNIYGAEKVGVYLGEYLTSHYDLPDRREDASYSHLKEMLSLYQMQADDAKLTTCDTFSDWLYALQDRYTVFLALSGASASEIQKIPEDVQKSLGNMGINMEAFTSGTDYAAVLTKTQDRDNKEGLSVVWEQAGNGIPDFSSSLEDGTIYQMGIWVPETEEEPALCSIRIQNQEYAKEEEGLHLVVYDPIDRDVADSIWVDLKSPELVLSH